MHFNITIQNFLVNKLIETFPQQLKDALDLSDQIKASNFSSDSIQHIVISGMGGSGIGVHVVKTIVEDHCQLPITLIQGYNLPKWVNESTLFIACSYSGNTEETLTLLNSARSKTQNLFAITTGGDLKKIADKNSIPQYNFSGEAQCPRAGLAYPSIAILMLLHKLGFCADLNIPAELTNAIHLLEKAQSKMKLEAEKLAKKMAGYFTFMYADQRFYGAVLRFQQQLAENSKQLSHAHVFPELNHNEIVGWQYPEYHLKKSKAVFLKTNFDYDRNQKRMDITADIISEKSEVLKIVAEGTSLTQQLYYLIHFIDWVSFYLAGENKIDPFPVENIDFLKSKLSQ